MWAALGAVGLMLVLGGCKPGPTAKLDTAADQAAIRAVLDRIAGDFNDGKIDSMLDHYVDDVVVLAPGVPDMHGKPAWKQALAQLPQGVPMRLKFDTTEMVVDGDLGYERGTYSLEMQGATINGRHIHIFRRQGDGSWKGWRLMENAEAPPAPLPPPSATPPPGR
jgi:ketosteroid isomerase-like protein